MTIYTPSIFPSTSQPPPHTHTHKCSNMSLSNLMGVLFICFVLDIPLNTVTTAHICMGVGPSECKYGKPSSGGHILTNI